MKKEEKQELTRDQIDAFMKKDMQSRAEQFKSDMRALQLKCRCEVVPFAVIEGGKVICDIKIVPKP